MLQIRIYVEVVSNMSFSVAARRLNLSQPTVSKQIAALEEEMNVSLIDRKGKNLSLTEAGRLVYNDFKDMLVRMDKLVQQAQAIDKNESANRLKIGIMHNLDVPKVSNNLLVRFLNDNPEIKIEFATGICNSVLREMCQKELVDCAFTLSTVSEAVNNSGELDSYIICEAPLRALFPQNKFPYDPSEGIEQLKGKPFIVIGDETAGNTPELEMLAKREIIPSDIIWADTLDAMMLYMEMGSGIGLINPTVRLLRLAQNTKSVTFSGMASDMVFAFIWRKDNENDALALLLNGLKDTSRFNIDA